MDLLDQLLQHDRWTTGRLLSLAEPLTDAELDRDFGLGPGTLRRTLAHIVRNVELWTRGVLHEVTDSPAPSSISDIRRRFEVWYPRFEDYARRVRDRNAWAATWTDTYDQPATQKAHAPTIAHLLTHSMHHRAQALHMLRELGVSHVPEGDVFSAARDATGSG